MKTTLSAIGVGVFFLCVCGGIKDCNNKANAIIIIRVELQVQSTPVREKKKTAEKVCFVLEKLVWKEIDE